MRFLLLTVTLIHAFVLNGCANKPAPKNPLDGSSLSTSAARSQLSPNETGLEVLRWTVVEASPRLPEALLTHRAGSIFDEATEQRLVRNGFRVVRVPVDQIDQILQECGGATVNMNEWMGQAPTWRSLQDRPVEASGRAVALDGRVRRFDRGEFRLLVRSWTVPMEDGPRVHLELVPQHARPANNIRRLLGERNQPIEGFAAAALDLQLEPGFAYVLVGESPQAKWDQPSTPSLPDGSGSLPPRLAQKPRVGPQDLAGPESDAPLTVGELLLPIDRGNPATRKVLVFVPRIPEHLIPQVAEDGGDMALRRSDR